MNLFFRPIVKHGGTFPFWIPDFLVNILYALKQEDQQTPCQDDIPLL